ncbi:MAG: hypothetical protein AB7I32_07170 [Gammaproteobacteria bacterium]
MFSKHPTLTTTLCGVCLAMATTFVHADDHRHATDAPSYGDSADIPASDPAVNRPQTTEQDNLNVRQAPSGPDIGPGAERDSLVPIPDDNDGRIDPQ